MSTTAPSPHPGILIAFEGLEGAGKTEMAHRLVESLNADPSHGYNQAEYVSEWQTRLGRKAKEALRFEAIDGQDFDPTPNNAMSEALLILAAKNEFITNVVRPGVAAGKILICDRYTATFMAYQGGMRQLGQAHLASLMQATQTDVMPNVEIFFEVSDETRRGRRLKVRDHMEAAVDNISEEMREHYTTALQHLPRYQRVVIDANGDRETVFAQLLTAIKARLKLHRITGASINRPPEELPNESIRLDLSKGAIAAWARTPDNYTILAEPSSGPAEVGISVNALMDELFQGGIQLPAELTQALADGSLQITLPADVLNSASTST